MSRVDLIMQEWTKSDSYAHLSTTVFTLSHSHGWRHCAVDKIWVWPKNEALNPTLRAGDVLHECLSAVNEVETEQVP